jgi:hypothetical protein
VAGRGRHDRLRLGASGLVEGEPLAVGVVRDEPARRAVAQPLGNPRRRPVAKVRRFYPRARLERPLGTPWLVLVRRREAEFDVILLAVALDRLGRVTSIEVPAGYVY